MSVLYHAKQIMISLSITTLSDLPTCVFSARHLTFLTRLGKTPRGITLIKTLSVEFTEVGTKMKGGATYI
jgi:hypothetical protein